MYIEGLDLRINYRLSLLLISSLACLFMESSWVAGQGWWGYYWPYNHSRAYVEQYNILDIETPSGSISGIPGQSYSYSTSAIDTDGDQVLYTFYWDDGSTSVTGPFDSGTSVTALHSWSKAGTYQVKAKANDADFPQRSVIRLMREEHKRKLLDAGVDPRLVQSLGRKQRKSSLW